MQFCRGTVQWTSSNRLNTIIYRCAWWMVYFKQIYQIRARKNSSVGLQQNIYLNSSPLFIFLQLLFGFRHSLLRNLYLSPPNLHKIRSINFFHTFSNMPMRKGTHGSRCVKTFRLSYSTIRFVLVLEIIVFALWSLSNYAALYLPWRGSQLITIDAWCVYDSFTQARSSSRCNIRCWLLFTAHVWSTHYKLTIKWMYVHGTNLVGFVVGLGSICAS